MIAQKFCFSDSLYTDWWPFCLWIKNNLVLYCLLVETTCLNILCSSFNNNWIFYLGLFRYWWDYHTLARWFLHLTIGRTIAILEWFRCFSLADDTCICQCRATTSRSPFVATNLAENDAGIAIYRMTNIPVKEVNHCLCPLHPVPSSRLHASTSHYMVTVTSCVWNKSQ